MRRASFRDAFKLLRSMHNLHGAQPHMVFGMADRVSSTPEDWIRKELLYLLTIDRQRRYDPNEPFERWGNEKREIRRTNVE